MELKTQQEKKSFDWYKNVIASNGAVLKESGS